MTKFERTGYYPSGDQPRDVRHVTEEISIVLVGNFAKTFVVQTPAIAGNSSDDDFRFE